MMLDVISLIFLAASSYTDLAFRKVYNSAVISAVILGFGLNLFYGGAPGLWHAFMGLIAGFLFLILFYALGGVGAGDVKFMAAVGCLKGAKFVLAGGLYGAVLGGLAAVVVMLIEKRFLSTLKNILNSLLMLVTFKVPEAIKPDKSQASYLPYTVFLSLGMLLRLVELRYF